MLRRVIQRDGSLSLHGWRVPSRVGPAGSSRRSRSAGAEAPGLIRQHTQRRGLAGSVGSDEAGDHSCGDRHRRRGWRVCGRSRRRRALRAGPSLALRCEGPTSTRASGAAIWGGRSHSRQPPQASAFEPARNGSTAEDRRSGTARNPRREPSARAGRHGWRPWPDCGPR